MNGFLVGAYSAIGLIGNAELRLCHLNRCKAGLIKKVVSPSGVWQGFVGGLGMYSDPQICALVPEHHAAREG